MATRGLGGSRRATRRAADLPAAHRANRGLAHAARPLTGPIRHRDAAPHIDRHRAGCHGHHLRHGRHGDPDRPATAVDADAHPHPSDAHPDRTDSDSHNRPPIRGVPSCTRTTGDQGGFRFSLDGGATFFPGARALDLVAYTWDLDIDPRNPDIILELHQGILYRSENAGCTFHVQTTFRGNLWDNLVRAPSDPDLLVASSIYEELLMVSTDGGQTWQQEALPDDVVHFAIDRTDPGHWTFAGRLAALYVRTAKEAKWETRPIRFSSDQQIVSASHVDLPAAGKVRWLVGSSLEGLYRSENEGLSWQPASEELYVPVGSPAEPVLSVVVVSVIFAPEDPDVAYTVVNRVGRNAAQRGIWRSADGGHSWVQRVVDNQPVGDRKAQLTGGTQVFVSPHDPDHVFFAFGLSFGNYGTDLFRSKDGFQTLAVSHVDDFFEVKAMAFGPAAGTQQTPYVFVGASNDKANQQSALARHSKDN